MTLALHGKTKRRQVGLLLGGLLAVMVAIAGGLALRGDNDAKALTLGSANGTWTSATGAPITGANTSRIYWGTPASGSGQSSYLWESGPAATFTEGQDFLLGGFTHFNNPIYAPSITSATLNLPLAFTDPVTTRTVTVVFNHDETPNEADPCAYGGANDQGININGCADRVQLPTLGADQHFQIGDNLYTLAFTGFHPVDPGAVCPTNDPGTGEVTTFLTMEEAENKGCVYAKLTFVAPVVDVAKAAVASPISYGQDAKFKITVTNASEAEAHGWNLTDTLPAGYTWSMESGPAACDVTSNVLTCTDLTVPAGSVTVPGKVEIVVKASTVGAACEPITNLLVTITKGSLTETAGPATITVTDCERKIRVVKVTDTADHPGGTFSGSIAPGPDTSWSQTLAADASASTGEVNGVSFAEQTVTEGPLPTGWSNVGYYQAADPNGDAVCGTTYTSDNTVPADTNNYLVCVKNNYTPPTHSIQICKVVEENNDGVSQSGNFSGEIRQWTATATFTAVPWAVTGVQEGGEPVCTTVTSIPEDRTFNVTEFGFRPAGWISDASGYPWYSDNQGMTHSANVTTVNYTDDVIVTFHNKSMPATRNVTVCKVVVGNGDGIIESGFSYGFDIRPEEAANVSGSNNAAEASPDTDGAEGTEVCSTKQVRSDKAFDVVEWMSRPTGWADATGYPKYSINDGAQVSNNTTTKIAAGTSDVNVTFYNKAVAKTGTIRIEKADSVNGTAGPAWEFTVSGGSYSGANPTADQDAPFEATVLLSNTPITITEVAARTLEQCAEANMYYTIATPPADNVINTPGEIQTWTFQNIPCGIFGTGGVVIEKYLDRNGDGDADDPGDEAIDGWSFTTTGGGVLPANQVRQTAGGGQILDYVSGFDAGTVLTVTEGAVAGFTLTGVTLDGVDIGTNVTNGVVVIGGETRVIRYYNQPLGSITVEKQTFRLGAAEGRDFNDDDGWRITVTSAACGVAVSGLTGTDGTVTFTGLPLCDDYVVAEDLTAPGAPGYAPLTSATVTGVTPALTGATRVTFVNTLFEFVPFTPTPVPPTPTVVPPTTTVVPPTATPAEPSTPTPAGTVLGERTPGPIAPTPIVPSTGDGADGTGAGFNLALVAAGLTALAVGFGATVFYGKRRQ